MRFIADDGMEFDNLEDCQKYEQKIAHLSESKPKRLKELNDAYDKYCKLADNYFKDYGEDPQSHFKTWDYLFDKFFA